MLSSPAWPHSWREVAPTVPPFWWHRPRGETPHVNQLLRNSLHFFPLTVVLFTFVKLYKWPGGTGGESLSFGDWQRLQVPQQLSSGPCGWVPEGLPASRLRAPAQLLQCPPRTLFVYLTFFPSRLSLFRS